MVMKLLIGATVLSAPLVAGHGYMTLPKATFKSGVNDITAFAGTIDSSQFTAPSGMSFSTDPESNTKAFTAWFKTSGYTSLKDLIVKKGGIDACGNTVLSTPQPLPDKVQWSHSSTEGFTPSHEGPCEVWCDNKMAFHDDNCAKDYTTAPAELPYDKSKCTGAKQLTFYWLALHSTAWQEYVNCAALSGASSSGSSSGGSSSASTTTTPTTTAMPSTDSPATNAPTTDTPTVTPASTPAPASTSAPKSGNKCTKRRR